MNYDQWLQLPYQLTRRHWCEVCSTQTDQGDLDSHGVFVCVDCQEEEE